VNAVSDASPLIIPAKIGRFDLLTKLYRTIYISSEVHAEVTVCGAGLPGASVVANAGKKLAQQQGLRFAAWWEFWKPYSCEGRFRI
jgi:predicted nucleic acid-binding protein